MYTPFIIRRWTNPLILSPLIRPTSRLTGGPPSVCLLLGRQPLGGDSISGSHLGNLRGRPSYISDHEIGTWKTYRIESTFFVKATGIFAGFRGFKLMEINSNGCFPGTYVCLEGTSTLDAKNLWSFLSDLHFDLDILFCLFSWWFYHGKENHFSTTIWGICLSFFPNTQQANLRVETSYTRVCGVFSVAFLFSPCVTVAFSYGIWLI